ncbi:hypothetical protein GCM10008931_14760 [Oceanobacillus oncorhynchi subsp. oncorhynchi]
MNFSKKLTVGLRNNKELANNSFNKYQEIFGSVLTYTAVKEENGEAF